MTDVNAPGGEGRAWHPSADVGETEDGFDIRLDLPGIEKGGVKVSVFGDTVTVRGERKVESKEKGENWHRVERSSGVFERSFTLGVALDADKVKASYKDGVLAVRVPKAETARPREIEVDISG
jgi:HSP20 family protein